MNTYSKGKRVDKCKWCSKVFASKQSKCNHQKCCKGNPQRREEKCKCDGCGYTTERIDSLKRHNKTCKGAKKLKICVVCKMEFSRNEHLKRHMVLQHERPKHYECEFCGKIFTRKDFWKKHEEILCACRIVYSQVVMIKLLCWKDRLA